MNDLIIDLTTWRSAIPEIDEYLRTHDRIQLCKDFVEDGVLKQGRFTFDKNNKDVIYTFTVNDPKPIEIVFEGEQL